MSMSDRAPECGFSTSYRPQRLDRSRGGAAGRVAPHHLQPDSRRPAADRPHAGRVAARDARIGHGSGRPPPPESRPSEKAGRVTHGVVVTALVTLFLLAASVQPALAQRRARLSEDLADHLAAGSQTIDVIVHGDAAEVTALARKYNLRVKKSMRSGAVVRHERQPAGGAAGATKAIDHLSGDSQDPVARAT